MGTEYRKTTELKKRPSKRVTEMADEVFRIIDDQTNNSPKGDLGGVSVLDVVELLGKRYTKFEVRARITRLFLDGRIKRYKGTRNGKATHIYYTQREEQVDMGRATFGRGRSLEGFRDYVKKEDHILYPAIIKAKLGWNPDDKVLMTHNPTIRGDLRRHFEQMAVKYFGLGVTVVYDSESPPKLASVMPRLPKERLIPLPNLTEQSAPKPVEPQTPPPLVPEAPVAPTAMLKGFSCVCGGLVPVMEGNEIKTPSILPCYVCARKYFVHGETAYELCGKPIHLSLWEVTQRA